MGSKMVRTRCFMSSNRGFLFPGKRFCHFWDMRCRHFMSSNRGFFFFENKGCHFLDMRCRHFMSSNRGFFFSENKGCHFLDMLVVGLVVRPTLIIVIFVVTGIIKFIPWPMIVIRFSRGFLPFCDAMCRRKCHLPAKREYHCRSSIHSWKWINDCNSAAHLNVALFGANEFGCNRHWQWFNAFAFGFYWWTTYRAHVFCFQGWQ